MIEAVYEQRGQTLTLRLRGHAGAAPAGQDLICAGVTTLAYALAQTVADHAARGQLGQEPQLQLSAGDALICAEPSPAFYEAVRGAFEMANAGLKLLSRHYPDHIRVKEDTLRRNSQ